MLVKFICIKILYNLKVGWFDRQPSEIYTTSDAVVVLRTHQSAQKQDKNKHTFITKQK